jgi:hypothetical protein
MQYFATLPKILKTDATGQSILMTNLVSRLSVVPSLLNNAALFYQYDIQDTDTPESIAYKYYGESYRYWIVLFANQIIDPQWNWPMNNVVFAEYLANKYPDVDVYTVTHHYEKIITQFDAGTNTTTVDKVEISLDDYNNLYPSTNSYSLPTGQATVIISKSAVSIYDYELGLNEANRTIRILNNTFVGEIEKEFKSLMKS